MAPPNGLGGISRERFRRGSSNFTRLSMTSGPSNQPETASLAPSSRQQNAVKYYRKVRKTGPKYRKRLITRQRCEVRQKLSVLQRQRRLRISRVKNIGSVLELSGVAFRILPPYGGLLVSTCEAVAFNEKQLGAYRFFFTDSKKESDSDCFLVLSNVLTICSCSRTAEQILRYHLAT